MTTKSFRVYAWTVLTAGVVLFAAPAHAQYRPQPMTEPPSSELFHIEGGLGWWSPNSNMSIASAGGGALSRILGDTINAKADLGFQDGKLPEFQLVLRPVRSHKLRMQYIPINYT